MVIFRLDPKLQFPYVVESLMALADGNSLQQKM